MKHHTTNSFSQTDTFWYKNKNARKPEKKVIHSQNVELILQSNSKLNGGVNAKTNIGIKAMIGIYFFIIVKSGGF